MTATPPLPGSSSAFAADDPGFRHPLTRKLLAYSGYTTPALEAILAAELAVRVVYQTEMGASQLPCAVTDGLNVSRRARVLVRRSQLTAAELTVSVNYVVSVTGPTETYGLDNSHAPIGRSLISRGVRQQRRILRTGLARWPDGRDCAARSYLLIVDQPLCYIRESFNPNLVPAAHDRSVDTCWYDEPYSVPRGARSA